MKNKYARFIVIVLVLGFSLLWLKHTYVWYNKTPQTQQNLANTSPRIIEEIRDSIFIKIDDLRQIIGKSEKYYIKKKKKVFLDIRANSQKFVLKMSKARLKNIIKITRAGLNDETLNNEVEKFVTTQTKVLKEITRLNKILAVKALKKQIVKLGLDLAGGIHIVLGVDMDKLRIKLKDKFKEKWRTFIPYLKKDSTWKNKTEDEIEEEAKRRAQDYIEKRIAAEVREAPDRAKEVIQNRIDQFGVSEVTIRTGPNNTIIIQLPGANDVAAAEEILTRTGNLTMQILDTTFMRQVPFTYKGTERSNQLYITDPSMIRKLKALFKKAYNNPNDTVKLTVRNPVSNSEKVIPIPVTSNIYDVQTRDQFGIPKTIGAVVLKRKVLFEGNLISDAEVNFRQGIGSNEPLVSFELNADGAELFAKITKANKGKMLAILLDGKVKSAPRIHEPITTGRGQISGSFTMKEATFLSGILKAGALKVPLKIEQLRVVGPSLGQHQINLGINAFIVALVIVIIFMIFYYRVSGVLADVALMLNLFILMGILAKLGLTLTLPGIAGIILTIGMAVDANVIINERIKEEIKAGRGVDASIEAGYGKAFKAIFDANLTTIIAAFVISQVGTGPIRGFGVTLVVGIIASMFTALFVTRFFIDVVVKVFKLKKLSIFPIFKKYPGRG